MSRLFSGGIFNRPGPSSLPTIGESAARTQAMQAQAGLLEQQRQAAWYQAHPDRAVHILGHEGAAAIGIETPEWKLEQKRKEAEIHWDTQYTARNKQRIAGIQNGVQQAEASGLFSPNEMIGVKRAAALKIAGIDKTVVPKSEEQQQMDAWNQEGKGIGMEWLDEWGNVKTREADGTIKTQVSYDKTQAGQEVKAQIGREKAQMEREKDLAEMRMKLEELTVKDPLTDKESPKYSPAVVDSKLKRMYRWYHEEQIQRMQEEQQAADGARAQAQEAAIQEDSENTMFTEAERMGLPVNDSDRSLGPQVGLAQAYLRKYGEYENVPDDKKQAWLDAFKEYSNALNTLER